MPRNIGHKSSSLLQLVNFIRLFHIEKLISGAVQIFYAMRTYTQEEVKDLLKKQREICAKLAIKYRFNKLYEQIQDAPEPSLAK